MSRHILHICRVEKFIPPFIDLVESRFGLEAHQFLLFGDHERYPVRDAAGIHKIRKGLFSRLKARWLLIRAMHQADKIMLHGLFNRTVTKLLWAMPWLLKKCYWVMWGDDLYRYQALSDTSGWTFKEAVRRRVIKYMGHLVTHIPGDAELARQWYGARGAFHYCLMYPSNVFHEITVREKSGERINIQVGNSADPGNHHFEVLDKLAAYKDDDIAIYVPLSYGSSQHADAVIAYGTRLFGEKFKPLADFMPFEDYLQFLSDIDIAVFNHRRQQAMGNKITLLGLGKKVYLRSDVTPWPVFDSLGIQVYDVAALDLQLIDTASRVSNQARVRDIFSEDRLVEQLEGIFEG